MGRIIIIPNSDFSRNHIVKVDIINKVETIVDNPTSYSSSTISVNNNSSLKNNE